MGEDRRVAMISGAFRGIGAAIAARLAENGWAVSLGVRDPASAAGPRDDNVLVCRFDALDAGSERVWVERTIARFGRLDGLVHTAGIMLKKTVRDARDDDFDLIFTAVAPSLGLRQCGRPSGVRATAICPSFVATDMAGGLTDAESAVLTQPGDIARILQMVLELPRTASIAELRVHFSVEDCY